MSKKRGRKRTLPIAMGVSIPLIILVTIMLAWREGGPGRASPGGIAAVGYVATPTPVPPPRVTGLSVDELLSEPRPQPRMYISATVWDTELNIQLLADVYVVQSKEFRMPHPDELVQASTNVINLSTAPNFVGWLVVRRDGFTDARIQLEYDLTRSKVIHGTIEMASTRLRFWGDDIDPKQ